MTSFVQRFIDDRSGATAIEYALVAALLGLVISAALNIAGGALYNKLNNVNNAVN